MSEVPQLNPDSIDPKVVESIILQGIPHCKALGVKVIEVSRSHVTLSLPYNPDLVGDPASGILHGGAVTSLVDSVAGMAVFAAMQKLQAVATLDLRIDYLKPALAEKELYATAECYKLTRSIAFVRARAYHPETPDDLVANCVATFMIGSSDKPPLPKGTKVPGVPA
ncbi:MAG: PaaI family thioesterase [Ferrovibrio sp.]|uniref:PaaI family thioesterase n=1 Tax=Ferrovibrio sp. TaxID=1917215 RepID=UPI00261408B8|nr:PaaI family thioesterase [Ferrovibrio sp.]MCW0232468.1 PaaI family thioesterase [Ferrovibrio sp.]